MAALNVEELRKEFDVPGGIEVAVDGIDLAVKEGEFVTLVGPSGCGKTTTLRCIAGLEQPTAGRITLGDVDFTDVPSNKRSMAMMFQNIALYPHMKIIDNIAYPLKIQHVPKEDRYESAREAANLMQIPDLLDKHPAELSGGQRQRAALARTMVQDPEVFLMDEPLSDLDAKLKVEVRKEIQRVHKRVGKPTVYVTHDQEEAMTMSDRIAVMNDGKIEQIGAPRELYFHPENRFVASFIGNPSMNFLSGSSVSLDEESGSITIQDSDIQFDIEYSRNPSSKSATVLGVRPEHVNIGEEVVNADFFGTVSVVEPIGEDMLVTLDGPEGEMRVVTGANNPVSEGEEIDVSIDRDSIYLFDSESGELVVKSHDRLKRSLAD